MNEVFISYSRRDSEFVKSLIEALKKAGIDPWQDIEDLTPAGRWRDELLVAIQACHDFIFVISPDSCVSDYCSKELIHALLHDKRVITILARYVSYTHIPQPLQEIQYIDFIKDFDLALKLLLRALDNPIGVTIGNRIDSKLELLSGRRKSINLYRNQYLIGRSPQGNIFESGLVFIGNRTVSKTHATLLRKDNRWHILDGFKEGRNYQVSLNGVLVNGRPIEPGSLKPLMTDDCIKLGTAVWLYTELSEDKSKQPEEDDRDTLIDKGEE